MFTLTVDPGVGGTGVAQWSNPLWKQLVPPVAVDCFAPKRPSAEWDERCDSIVVQFTQLLLQLTGKVTDAHIEYPALMVATGSGAASATRGDLVKLSVMVGRLAQCCHTNGVKYHFLPVNEWKGTMPKKVVDRRIKHRLGMKFDEHISDAVGMGLHLKGHFNQA